MSTQTSTRPRSLSTPRFSERRILTSTAAVTSSLSHTFQHEPAQAFHNQLEVENSTKRLQASLSKFSKLSKDWLELELGDIENWALLVETDFEIVNKTLLHIHEQYDQNSK
ncbi:hypothetical protein HK096_002746 [Nowakowskiella sp. JEL0078]|nr:hypothetical protein HK096_002746 [Nowakowskiella sp. JEL0078]